MTSTPPEEISARVDGHRNPWHRSAPFTSGDCTSSGGDDLATTRNHHTSMISIRLAANSARRAYASGLGQDTTERIHR